jgi:hypothetical protein
MAGGKAGCKRMTLACSQGSGAGAWISQHVKKVRALYVPLAARVTLTAVVPMSIASVCMITQSKLSSCAESPFRGIMITPPPPPRAHTTI